MSYLDALFSLNGKVALVTGSNRGIGYSLARGLARAGASVVLNGRDRERTEAAARDLKDEGLRRIDIDRGCDRSRSRHPRSEAKSKSNSAPSTSS